jgi:hypothetical protein
MADLAWSTRVTYKGYIERTILPTLGANDDCPHVSATAPSSSGG